MDVLSGFKSELLKAGYQETAGYFTKLSQPAIEVSFPKENFATLAAIEDGSFWFHHRAHLILSMLQKYPPRAASHTLSLDIGGGNGFLTSQLTQHGWPAVLVEPTLEGVTLSCQRNIACRVQGPFQDLPVHCFEDVGAIFLLDVIEHIQNDADFLQTLMARLRTGTKIYVTVPAFQWLWSIEDEMAGHFRRYNKTQLLEVFKNAGARPVFSSYFFAPAVPVKFLFRPWQTQDKKQEIAHTVAMLQTQSKLLNAWLKLETTLISAGWKIPTGGSILAVFEK